MKVMFSKAMYSEMEKAFGKKDLSKLRKEIITDKNGHRKTVYKKIDKPEESKGKGKAEPNEKKHSYAHTTGDHIIFNNGGTDMTGEIVGIGKEGVTVKGTGSGKGQTFRVKHEDVKQVTKMINPNDAIRGLMDENSVKSGWRGTNGMQPESCDTIKGLYDTIEAARGEFNNFTDSVTKVFAALSPIVMKRATLKSEDRIKEKLREDAKSESNPEIAKQIYDEKTDT